MSIIKTTNAQYILIRVNIVIKLFSLNSISDFSHKEITARIVMFFADLAFIKRLLWLAVYINMAKTVASKTYIFLRAVLCLMSNRKAIKTCRWLRAYCLIMANFIAFEANNVVLVISEVIFNFQISRVFFLLLNFSLRA